MTIDNRSGKMYTNASLKLIAGDVNTVNNNIQPRLKTATRSAKVMSTAAPSFS